MRTDDGNPTLPLLYLIPYGSDAAAAIAKVILEQTRPALPDLSRVTVLMPDPQAAPRLRQQLLKYAKKHDVTSLIGPNISSFHGWLANQATLSRPRLTPQQRELMLTEVLMEHPHLYGQGSPWALAHSLLELFDELTLHRVALPASYTDFVKRLSAAYGAGEGVEAHLGREATLVHTLWQAWQRQLADEGVMEPATARLLALAESLEKETEHRTLFLAGFYRFTDAELDWLKRLLTQHRGCLLLQGGGTDPVSHDHPHPDAIIDRLLKQLPQDPVYLQPTPDTGEPLTALLDAIYCQSETTLRERARRFASRYPCSPADGHLYLFEAGNSDEEARAIDIQVRRWLLAGLQQIGIVTENRRLARQVRALLEQGGVAIEDSAGWALSTTRAAASVERWLEAVEEEFDHRPLLDLLKSPFLFADMERDHFNTIVYRFEQDIVFNGNIARGMARYLQHLERRCHLLEWTGRHAAAIREMLERLELAAAPLLACLHGVHPPWRFMESLLQSMERLGMRAALNEDEAGMQVVEQLERLNDAARGSRLRMTWQAFRAWLGTNLERAHFRPPAGGSPVQLMNLSQSALSQFDAVIIASTEKEFLPGAGTPSPFFNDTVRLELGLPSRQEQLGERFYLFRRLLQAAPKVLFTLRREQDGEAVVPSPWLETLRAFHRLGYGTDLGDDGLSPLVHHPHTIPFRADTRELPAGTETPAPSAPPSLLPHTISASTYQQLMDCPYQFFAARCLKLAAPERIREALAKSDFGERVHRCLEAFHSDLPDLPGPFSPPFEAKRRQEATELLEEIAERVFANDLEDNFQHRGWLQQWKRLIPDYVEWQFQRAADYRVKQVELELTREVGGLAFPLLLRGRIDRLDAGGEGVAVVDYKTGSIAGREEIAGGEAVQLPFYALLLKERVARCEYLQLASQGVSSRAILEGDELTKLAEEIEQRLISILDAIYKGASLPAWGNERSCEYCPFTGICRRQTWEKMEQGNRN